MSFYRVRPCNCGSGLDWYPLTDAAGIFCTYVCEKCEETRRKEFDPAIFDERSSYAGTGEEMDIGRYPDEDY